MKVIRMSGLSSTRFILSFQLRIQPVQFVHQDPIKRDLMAMARQVKSII